MKSPPAPCWMRHNQTRWELRVEQHPDKTFIGRSERGFTFLGYWITKQGVTGIAPSAWNGFQERVARLYEQNAPLEVIQRGVALYVRRWNRWMLGRVRDVFVCDAIRLPGKSPDPYAFASPPSIQATQSPAA